VSEADGRLTGTGTFTCGDREPMEKQILALDSLSKLTRQFCDKPDFEHLVDILLMTLCGQFSVADSFALLRKPNSQTINQSFFATGRFKSEVLLTSIHLAPDESGWVRAIGSTAAAYIGASGVWSEGRLSALS
jgi:hypothetical protein